MTTIEAAQTEHVPKYHAYKNLLADGYTHWWSCSCDEPANVAYDSGDAATQGFRDHVSEARERARSEANPTVITEPVYLDIEVDSNLSRTFGFPTTRLRALLDPDGSMTWLYVTSGDGSAVVPAAGDPSTH